MSIINYVQGLNDVLKTMLVLKKEEPLELEKGVSLWLEETRLRRDQGRTIYFVGNGASATMASHMALDGTKNGGVKCMAFNDPAFLTAISNDISYDSVFSLPLESYGQEGDMLIAISSSGNSKNIVNVVEKAKEMKLYTVTLTGMNKDNQVRSMGDLNFYIPAESYGWVESAHQVLLHYWLDCLWEEQKGSNH